MGWDWPRSDPAACDLEGRVGAELTLLLLQQSAVVAVLAVCGSVCRGPSFQLLGIKGKGSVALSLVCIQQDRVAL